MLTAGLSGGIASGKTTVARMFHELGAEIVDADEISRELVEPGGQGLARIRHSFGRQMLTAQGRLDRERLAALVFSDPAARSELNALVHPLVAAGIHNLLAQLRRSGFDGVVIVDVPLLFECGWQDMFDRSIVVYCPPGVQRRRLLLRGGLSASQADARIAAQMPLREKKKRADFVIDNQGSIERLARRVTAVYRDLLSLCRPPGSGDRAPRRDALPRSGTEKKNTKKLDNTKA